MGDVEQQHDPAPNSREHKYEWDDDGHGIRGAAEPTMFWKEEESPYLHEMSPTS